MKYGFNVVYKFVITHPVRANKPEGVGLYSDISLAGVLYVSNIHIHPFNSTINPFNSTTNPFNSTINPFNSTINPFNSIDQPYLHPPLLHPNVNEVSHVQHSNISYVTYTHRYVVTTQRACSLNQSQMR